MRLRPFLTAVSCLSLCCWCAPGWAQARYNIHFRSARVSGAAGQVVTMGVGLDNQPEKVTAFSFGVKHDAAKLSVQSVDIGPDLQAALGAGNAPDPQFFALNLLPAGGTGFTVAMILSAQNPAVALAPGLDHHIFNIQYKLPDGATGDTKVDITGDLGTPKVPVILDVNNGTSQAPAGAAATTSATIGVGTGTTVPFLRGDANQSGRLETTDAIILLNYLFGGGTFPAGAGTRTSCIVAFNVDGTTDKGTAGVEDQLDIGITDALYLLIYLFQRGAAPPAPFPQCGEPAMPADAAIQCTEFTCH
jgi:hypothetical protein